MSMNERTALITGASRGLGRALAEHLAAEGARVVLVARGRAALDEVVDSIRRRGGEAWGVVADVGDPEAIERIAGQAAALAGPVDLLVNNASTLGAVPLPALADAPSGSLERTFAVNLFGPYRLTRRLLGAMVLAGRGVVVNISSDAAVEAYPTWGAYGASKAALDHLTRTFAAELEGAGVRVFSVDPGEMDTAMHAAALPDADPATLAAPAVVAASIARLIQSAPAGARLSAGEVTA